MNINKNTFFKFSIKILLNGNNKENIVLFSDEGVAASYANENKFKFHRKLIFGAGVIQCSKLTDIRTS